MTNKTNPQSNTPEGKVTAADIVAENFKGLPHLIKNANLSLFYCDLIVICMKDYAALQSADLTRQLESAREALELHEQLNVQVGFMILEMESHAFQSDASSDAILKRVKGIRASIAKFYADAINEKIERENGETKA